MKHQLIPNTYTICESTEQCKELFEWAKANGVKTRYRYHTGETCMVVNEDLSLSTTDLDICESENWQPIPLPEFIPRLKGEWVEGITLKLTKEQAEWLSNVMEFTPHENANAIQQQLNQHQ